MVKPLGLRFEALPDFPLLFELGRQVVDPLHHRFLPFDDCFLGLIVVRLHGVANLLVVAVSKGVVQTSVGPRELVLPLFLRLSFLFLFATLLLLALCLREPLVLRLFLPLRLQTLKLFKKRLPFLARLEVGSKLGGASLADPLKFFRLKAAALQVRCCYSLVVLRCSRKLQGSLILPPLQCFLSLGLEGSVVDPRCMTCFFKIPVGRLFPLLPPAFKFPPVVPLPYLLAESLLVDSPAW